MASYTLKSLVVAALLCSTPLWANTEVIGTYNNGCMAESATLPDDGQGYQLQRPSRQRNYGHPELITFVQSLSEQLHQRHGKWLMIGDLSMDNGGPFTYGHRSHQIGLDVDIPFRTLNAPTSADKREKMGDVYLVTAKGKAIEGNWQPIHRDMIKSAASYPQVERIFVNPAIKRELCASASEQDTDWLRKVRPWFNHMAHMHVRLACPENSASCEAQDPPPAGNGCGEELASWFLPPPPPDPNAKPAAPAPKLVLPQRCQRLLASRK